MAHTLKVVFRSDVSGIAQAGDVKTVSPGYARNYLFPRQLAFPATPASLRQWETERLGTVAKAAKLREDIQSVAQRIESVTVEIPAKAGPEGQLFGSITRKEIADALALQGLTVDKHAILLPQPIKQIGASNVTVRLGAGVQAQLKVNVISETGSN